MIVVLQAIGSIAVAAVVIVVVLTCIDRLIHGSWTRLW